MEGGRQISLSTGAFRETGPCNSSHVRLLPRNDGAFRLAILATHPIQYYAPWFRHLATQVDLEVLYAHRQDGRGQANAGFGVDFEWDIPLLEGYRHRWLRNVSRRPGLQNFGGCDSPELFQLIHPSRYDAVLVTGWNRKSFVQAIQAAWWNGVSILARGDSNLQTARSAIRRFLKRPLYRLVLPRIDAHLYVGALNRRYLRHYGVCEKQMFFCPHFVDNQFFASRAEQARRSGSAAAIRTALGIPDTSFVALFVGKFIRKKRTDHFVQAAISAMEQRPNLHAILVGDGPMRAEVEELAASRRDRIHFPGFKNQTELAPFYAAADVLVLPSNAEETWGLVVNEAMASGIPAIVSEDVGCAPDLIEDEVTGWTYPSGDWKTLSQRLVECHRVRSEDLIRKCELYSISRATAGLESAISFSTA